MDNQKTGLLISERRAELGLTQKQLGEQLHISDRTVSKWERGSGFPDISLLEPLADALGLSVLELLQGERMEVPHEQAEDTVRDAARTFGARFKTSFRRLRRALIALAVVAAALLIAWLRLSQLGWLDRFYFSMEEISAADALEICPFALITTEEYNVMRQIFQEEEIKTHSDLAETYTADDPFLRKYDGMFFINGEPAEVVEIAVLSSNSTVYVTYRVENMVCILNSPISGDSITKTCAQYKDDPGSEWLYIVLNQDNQTFSMAKEDSKLSQMLSN